MATYTTQCGAVGAFGYANYFKLYVVLTEIDENIENNTSKIQYNIYCQSSGSGSINAKHLKYFNLNGTDIINTTESVNVSSPNAYIPIASGTTSAIAHNTDGSKTVSFSAKIQASSYGVSASLSGTFTLKTIARASSVSGGSGNIDSTTTISISRASSSFTHTLRYAFGSLSETIATGVGTSYTWTIPTTFYAQIPSAKSGTGTIYCDTYNGSTLIGTKSVSFTATATESNCRPTVSATITDTNSTTTALTGDSSKLVKYKSTAQLVITSTVKNSASIKSVTVNGTGVGTSSSITLNYSNVSTTNFTIVTTDSRGYTNTSYVVTPSYVNYVPLTVNAKFFRPQPTTGEVQLTYSGNYFNGSFGSVSNALTITWKYKASTDSSYTTGGTITPTFSGNKISSSTISLGSSFDYQTAYDFQLMAVDKLTTATVNSTVSVGMPVFYWGKDFFRLTQNPTLLRNSSDDATMYGAERTDTETKVRFGVSADGTRHGIYSDKLSKWLIYGDDSKTYLSGGAVSISSGGIMSGFMQYHGNAPTDLNNATTHGTYNLTGASYTNAHASGSLYGILIVEVNRGDTWTASDQGRWIWQTIKTTGGTIYRRYAVNTSTFSPWIKENNKALSSTIYSPNTSITSGSWQSINSTSHSATLGIGKYLVIISAAIAGSGSGIATLRPLVNNAEISGAIRSTIPLTSGLTSSTQVSFPYTVSTAGTFTFNGQLYTNASCTISQNRVDILQVE